MQKLYLGIFMSFLAPVLLSSTNTIILEQIADVRRDDEGRHIFRSESYDYRNIVLDDEMGIVYVGAVNHIYALDIDDVSVKIGEINWSPNRFLLQNCINFKSGRGMCENNIRVLHSVNSTFLYACGTMAYDPTCTYIDKRNFKQLEEHSERGKWRSPYDPFSSTISIMIDGTLFAATTDGSDTSDGIISKTLNKASLRTQEKDKFWLSDPHFVSAFQVSHEPGQDKVYMLLREKAEEIPTQFLSQDTDDSLRVMYSRVVSLCTNDHGGNRWVLNNKFATFTKMRIACPSTYRKGERTVPFYYDEIQDSYIVPNPEEPSNPTIYAIFTMPEGSIDATATCVYQMHDLQRAMTTNKYWNRPGTSFHPYSSYELGDGYPPDTCVPDTRSLSDDRLKFSKDHPIKYGIIQPSGKSAIYQHAGLRFSHIVVDRITINEKQGSGDENKYDVVHYITADGYIKRVVFDVSDRSLHWDIPSRHVYYHNETKHKVLSVKIANGKLFVGTNASVIQISVASCSMYQSCSECVVARDPYCIWVESKENCLPATHHTHGFRLLAYTKRTNASICFENGFQGDKKSEDSEDPEKARLERLKNEILELNNLVQKQNESIQYLKHNLSSTQSSREKCVIERDILIKNYTSLATLILRYDASRKFAMKLYKNTVFSLHECQHKKTRMTQQLDDEQRAHKEAVKRASIGARVQNETTLAEEECEKLRTERESYLNTEPDRVDSRRFTNECEDRSRQQKERFDQIVKENAIFAKEGRKTSDSLRKCVQKSIYLENRVGFLAASNRNMTEENKILKKINNQEKKTNERLRWLHRRNGRRGSQLCEHNEWFVLGSTKKMFHLSRQGMTFSKAEALCRDLNATLISLYDEEEIRYIHNIIRAFEPGRHFWLGLVKVGNGTMKWTDGSIYEAGDTERFPMSQRERLTNGDSYCAETNSRQRWQLISCNRSRRPLCQKDYSKDYRISEYITKESEDEIEQHEMTTYTKEDY